MIPVIVTSVLPHFAVTDGVSPKKFLARSEHNYVISVVTFHFQ